MDEIMETEVTQEQIDAEWGDVQEADQPIEEPAAEKSEQEPAANQPGPDAGNTPKADQPQRFTIKNRDETREVTQEELVSMAQKGWDYDKVREERDQLRQYRTEADPALELVKSYAQRNNMSVSDYLDYCRRKELMDGGMNQKDAEQKIQLDKERAALDKDRAEIEKFQQEQNSMKQRAMEAQEARKRDIEAFFKAYPNVDPNTIPLEVWAEVQKGDTLTNAYTMHENQRLQAEISALKQNEKNRKQSPGSLGGSSGKEIDEIDRIWAEDD